MNGQRGRPFGAALLLCGLVACGGGEIEPELLQATPTFERDIAPLLNRHCVECHDHEGVHDGGVELDSYEAVFAARVKNVCVSINTTLIEQSRDALLPAARSPEVALEPCNGWAPFSMPVGAKPKLTEHEQVILLRWLLTGAAP